MGCGLTGRRAVLCAAAATIIEPVATRQISLSWWAAERFADSVGVCTHLDSPPYRDQFDLLLARLRTLGVRHFRDDLRPGNDLARWRRVCDVNAMKAHMLASPAEGSVDDVLRAIAAVGANRVSAVEGQNEGDGAWFMAQPQAQPDWATAVVAYQRGLFAAVSRAYGRRRPRVVSPTVLNYKPRDMAALRPAADACDAVALHAYPQNQQEPETADDYAAVGWYRREIADRFKPGAPLMITETGYSQFGRGMSARSLERYTPRLLLHAFTSGITRTFIYELLDEGTDRSDSEQGFGLLTVDGEPKPAFHAVAMLLREIASDGGHRSAPVSVSGPADLRGTGLVRRDGSAVLALWRTARSWDPGLQRDIVVPPAAVTISTRSRAATVETRTLAAGEEWTSRPTARGSLTIAVADTVTLVRLP